MLRQKAAVHLFCTPKRGRNRLRRNSLDLRVSRYRVGALTERRLAEAWQRWKVYSEPDARKELIEHYAPSAKITAARVIPSGVPARYHEDLYSEAVKALIESVDRFDPSLGFRFETYAISRMKWAVQDAVRQLDWMPRSVRQGLQQLEAATKLLQARLGRAPTAVQIASELRIQVEQVEELQRRLESSRVVLFDDVAAGDSAGSAHEEIPDQSQSTLDRLLSAEMREHLKEFVNSLPYRERVVISLYYVQGLTFREVARVLEVSESRAFQIHNQAIRRLRASLELTGEKAYVS
jgi:RNA polymerase sigma factor FliA